MNFSFFGDEGDAFGNVLAVMYGLMDKPAAMRTLRALKSLRRGRALPTASYRSTDSEKERAVETVHGASSTERSVAVP